MNNEFEAQYEEIKNVPPRNKGDNAFKVIIVFLVISLVLAIGGIVLYYFYNDGSLEKKKDNKPEEKITLKYTETSKNKVEGIYMIDVSDVVDKVMPSIVSITSKTLINNGQYGFSYFYGQEQYATGAGSGIIINQNKNELLILTNYHVVEDAKELSVQFLDGKSVDATVKGYYKSRDIAVISIPIKNIDSSTLKEIKIATMGDSSKLRVGEGVIAIGNALGYGQSVTTGVVSALNREVRIDNITNNMIQTDAAINGGNSGGALLNSKGEVIGINSAKYSSNGSSQSASIEGMGFAIPITDVKDIIENLMNGKTLTEKERGYLGVSGYQITSEYSEHYNIPVGFYIDSITKNGGADKAGLEIGNIIVKIEDKEVTKYEVISDILSTKKAKDKVKIRVAYVSGREYKEKDVVVTLSSYNEAQ